MLSKFFNIKSEEELVNKSEKTITREEALQLLKINEDDFDEYMMWKSFTPLQRVIKDLDFKEDMLSLLLQGSSYWHLNKDKLKFEFTSKEEYIANIEKILGKLKSTADTPMRTSRMNRIDFIHALYALYGVFYISKNGKKEETLEELSKSSFIPISFEDIILYGTPGETIKADTSDDIGDIGKDRDMHKPSESKEGIGVSLLPLPVEKAVKPVYKTTRHKFEKRHRSKEKLD